jgi:hypothetical protein
MPINVTREVTALQEMTTHELQERYRELFGEPTRMHHKQYLVKRIIWRMQALAEGDLSDRARQRATELANDADLRIYAPSQAGSASPEPDPTRVVGIRFAPDDRLPVPGTVLTRTYKGRLIQATVRPDGFEYDGEFYRTLTAIAKAITGTHWNGFRFFNLGKCRKAE